MTEVLIAGTIIDILQFIIVGIAVWTSLRFLDRSSGRRFTHVIEKISEDSFALSVYYGLRIVAAAVLFGSVAG